MKTLTSKRKQRISEEEESYRRDMLKLPKNPKLLEATHFGMIIANISEIQEAATQNKGNSSLFPEEHQAQAKQPPSAVDTGAPETAPPALKSLNRLKNGFKNRFSQGFEHFKGVVGVSPRAPNVCTTNDRGEEVTEDDDHSTATRRFSNRESIVPARFTYD